VPPVLIASAGEPATYRTLLAGRYDLIERIGSGHTGVVWRCHDTELDDEVAIKLLRGDLVAAERLDERLRRAARLARQVTHPNAARVFELGRAANDHFLTMEYIRGESLRRWIDRGGPMRPAWVQALAVSLCRGLAAALTVGVIHGAVRASNVLLAPGRGPVLTDFGIDSACALPLTGAQRPAGNLAYLAPERWHGGDITTRGDVFAVGVVLFEALTGQLPWGDDAFALAARSARGGEPLHWPVSGVPELWRELVADCLRDDPAQRPADVRSLLVRLGAGRWREPAGESVSCGRGRSSR